MKTSLLEWFFASLIVWGCLLVVTPVEKAQALPPSAIVSISVCSPNGTGGPGSCPSGSFDTHQIVLAPDGSGNAINSYNGMVGISDEHQSVFSPGTLQGNGDYLFFVATRTEIGAPSTGVVVLSGGTGPNNNGQWTMDFAKTDGYDSYPSGFGEIFVAPTGPNCPTVADGNPADQDQTFDLKYAAPGSVVVDPTAGPGNLLMIYEGTNTCVGTTGGATGNFYSTIGVATSLDYGRTWPTYRGDATFNFVPLPGENPSQGPDAPMGALGNSVCIGNDCTTPPPAHYGRYAVLSPSVSLVTAMATAEPLPSSMGDSEMSAFVDDVSASPAQYIYIVYDYKGGTGALADPSAPSNGLMIARAQLNGGTAPLSFLKWNGQAFAGLGLGGYDSPVFPVGPFENCEAQSQLGFGGSISYVEDTQQYLLTFVCDSPGDPVNGQVAGAPRGAAWFYSTSYDLSDPGQWSPPQEIVGSWSEYDTSGGCSYYKGFYPTLMSLGSKPGHLTTSGYVFYLWGCQTDNTPPPGRQYASRAFAITTAPPVINISIAPAGLSFGNIDVGQFANHTITIMNEASSTGVLTGNVGSLLPPFSVVSGGGAFNLAPGQSVTVTVRFSPTTAGPTSASLSITHDATNQTSPSSISISGTGMNVPVISVTLTSNNYGTVKVKRSSTASFVIKNNGKANLSITSSTITGTDASMFKITSGSGSKTIKPGKTLTIKVAFKPTSTGSKSADLEITSNDPVTPTLDIPLSGTGQ